MTTVVKNAFQAPALDEFRSAYWAMLWTVLVPDKPDPGLAVDDNRTVEQRWFSGAHANLGGGYPQDLLPQRPLSWIQNKAAGCGLAFRQSVLLNDDDYASRPVDSYAEFLHGAWRLTHARYVRWVQSERVRKPTGWVKTLNERIDRSVFERCRRYPDYRPLSLLEWSRREGCDLEQVIRDAAKIHELDRPVAGPGLEVWLVALAKQAGKPR